MGLFFIPQMFHATALSISLGTILLQRDNVCPPSGLLEEQLLVKVIKDKLMSNPCKNQGFVLDGFPKSYEQARELFSGEMLDHVGPRLDHRSMVSPRHQTVSVCLRTDEQESDDVTFVAPPKSKRILPGW